MNIGNKIKSARVEKKITQKELCGEKITRNMLSAIENGKATPSLDTLIYLSEKLELSLPYLCSNDSSSFFYDKNSLISNVKSALEEGNYNLCISLVRKIGGLDDELSFILAKCYFELGVGSIKLGALKTGASQLNDCLLYCKSTLYDTKRFESIIPLYLAISENINAPLLEFDEGRFVSLLNDSADYEFYRYLVLDTEYRYTSFHYGAHIKARALIREKKYNEALDILCEIERRKAEISYNAYFMFGLYSDLETCYKQTLDFESAYKYATKRISLMEGFNS